MLDRSFDANSIQHELFAFDEEVPTGWRRTTRLQLSADRIIWGPDLVPLVAITGIAWSTRSKTINLTQTSTERSVRLVHPNGVLDIGMGGQAFGPANDPVHASAFAHLIQLLGDMVEPRIRLEQLSRLRSAIEPVTVGGIPMSVDGIHHQRIFGGAQVTPWADFPTALIEGEHVLIRCGAALEPEVVAQRTTSVVNAVTLPGLLHDIALGAL